MPIEEAADFFEAITSIHRYLKTLVEVGLGYVRLGQPATTLSGGEAQRVKLAAELQKRSTGRTVYILDEPTTGLHFEDIRKLLGVVNGLVDKGNTVIVIEHNLDVIKVSDWVIDMGPEGGSGGGMVVAQGDPEAVAAVPESYTGKFLQEALTREPSSPRGEGCPEEAQARRSLPSHRRRPPQGTARDTTKPHPVLTGCGFVFVRSLGGSRSVHRTGELLARALSWLVRVRGGLTECALQRLKAVTDGSGVGAEVSTDAVTRPASAVMTRRASSRSR